MKPLRGDLNARAYSGILAEPMPKWGALTQPPENEVDELIDEKWKALFAHYGLDPTDAFELGPKKASAWANLAWHLARQHVPGFRHAPRKRGKPAERKSDDVTLFMHVELLKRRDRLSEHKAIQIIASQNIVSGSEGTLLQRYKRAKKPVPPDVRNVRQSRVFYWHRRDCVFVGGRVIWGQKRNNFVPSSSL